MNKKSVTRVILVLLILILTVAAALIAVKLNSKNPLDSSIGNTKTRATFQKQIDLPNVTIPPTDAPTPITTTSSEEETIPTQKLLAVASTSPISPTESEIVVAQTTPTSTLSASLTTTITSTATTTDTLPAAGSYQPLLVLALAASMVVVVSLLF